MRIGKSDLGLELFWWARQKTTVKRRLVLLRVTAFRTGDAMDGVFEQPGRSGQWAVEVAKASVGACLPFGRMGWNREAFWGRERHFGVVMESTGESS